MSSSDSSSGSDDDEPVPDPAPVQAPQQAWRPAPQFRERRQKKGKGPGGLKTAKVNMPNGDCVFITIPVSSKCECTKKCDTALIPLTPDGKMSSVEYNIVKTQMLATIRQHPVTGGGGIFTRYEIIKISKVKNCCLWSRYRHRQRELAKEIGYVNERMLFHGSSATDEILATGFDERHADRVGLFGAGIYFSEHSSKSNQYVFGYCGGNGCKKHRDKNCYCCPRNMLLCRVALGKSCKRTQPDKMSHPPPGYHSIKGEPTVLGLQYPEYVIYRGEQAYPEYLITFRIAK